MSLEINLDDLESHNYWEGVDVFAEVLPVAAVILNSEFRKTDDEVCLGSREGNRFSIFEDNVFFDFDLRYPDLEVLESFLRMARRFDCKLVAGNDGRVIEPQMLEILDEIMESNALKFVVDPQRWLTDVAAKHNRLRPE